MRDGRAGAARPAGAHLLELDAVARNLSPGRRLELEVQMQARTEGMVIPAWSGRRAADALARVKAEGRRWQTPCVECAQSIDYSLPSTHPEGCTVQHLRSRKLFPELTWAPSNWAPAHKACNESAGAGDRADDAGVTSAEW